MLEIIIQIAVPLISLLAAWGMKKLTAYLGAKTGNEVAAGMLLKLTTAAVHVVKELEQTIVEATKEAAADGKLDEADRKRIMELAVQKVKSFLSMKGVSDLIKMLELKGTHDQKSEQLDNYVRTFIESALYDLKKK